MSDFAVPSWLTVLSRTARAGGPRHIQPGVTDVESLRMVVQPFAGFQIDSGTRIPFYLNCVLVGSMSIRHITSAMRVGAFAPPFVFLVSGLFPIAVWKKESPSIRMGEVMEHATRILCLHFSAPPPNLSFYPPIPFPLWSESPPQKCNADLVFEGIWVPCCSAERLTPPP